MDPILQKNLNFAQQMRQNTAKQRLVTLGKDTELEKTFRIKTVTQGDAVHFVGRIDSGVYGVFDIVEPGERVRLGAIFKEDPEQGKEMLNYSKNVEDGLICLSVVEPVKIVLREEDIQDDNTITVDDLRSNYSAEDVDHLVKRIKAISGIKDNEEKK